MSIKLTEKTISVIICAYNRASYVIEGLKTLTNQSVDKKYYEVIVVDNNCTDNTAELCNSFFEKNNDLNFKYVYETKQGLSYARNKGIEIAQNEIITFIDDDAFTNSDYIKNIISTFEKYPEFDCIGGKVLPVFEEKEPKWLSKYIERIIAKVDYGEKFKPFKRKYPIGCNMIFKKKVFDIVGNFNVNLVYRSDEKYMFYKIKKAGIKTLYAPSIIAWHNIPKMRTSHHFIMKTAKLNGESDRIRLKSSNKFGVFLKFFDLIIKILISYLLLLGFTFKKQSIKGKYLIKVMQNTLYGFLFYKKI